MEGAYCLCPMHPFWQIKQAVRIGSDFHIDRCIVFGSSASPAIFISFNSLVTWIAKNKRRIPFATTYVDDTSGCTWSDDVAFYAPYNKHLPSPQTTYSSFGTSWASRTKKESKFMERQSLSLAFKSTQTRCPIHFLKSCRRSFSPS